MSAEQAFSIPSMLEEVLPFDETKYYPTRITPYHFQGDLASYRQFRAALERYYLLRQRELVRGDPHIVLSSSAEYQRCLETLKHWLQAMSARDSDRDVLESEESAVLELRRLSDYFYTRRISLGVAVPDCDEFRLLDKGFRPRPIAAKQDNAEERSIRQDQFFERAAANLAKAIIREDVNQQRRRAAATTLQEARRRSQGEGVFQPAEPTGEAAADAASSRAAAFPLRSMLGRAGTAGAAAARAELHPGQAKAPPQTWARTAKPSRLPREQGPERVLLRESPSHVYPACTLFVGECV